MFLLATISPSSAASVKLKWDANTEPDLAGYRVYHNVSSSPLSGTLPLDVSKKTTATLSGLDPDKSYSFAITAYNSSGLESSFSNIVYVGELIPPSVAITTPADKAKVSGIVSLSVDASDNVGVTKVEFFVNGVLKSSDTGSPYVYSWYTSTLAAGTYTLMVKAYDAAGNVSQSSRSVTVVNDLSVPVVALTSPANNATLSGTVTISSTASDNVGVSMVEFYSNNVLLYASNVSPYSYNWDTKGVGDGTYTILAKAYDNAGNSKQSTAVTVTVSNPVPDVIAPTVATFSLPATVASLTVPVSALTARDNKRVSGYLITENATKPVATASGWSAAAPTGFTFSSAGVKTAYAWAKDAAGNISAGKSAAVTITLADTVAPTVATFRLPATAASLTVPVSALTASDNKRVSGYLITESATKPVVTASGWSAAAPTSFTFRSAGVKTAYAWAKDAAGNISAGKSAAVTINLADTTAPTVATFRLPATVASLTVPVLSKVVGRSL